MSVSVVSNVMTISELGAAIKGAALTSVAFLAKHVSESVAVGLLVTGTVWTTVSAVQRSRARELAGDGSLAKEMAELIRKELFNTVAEDNDGIYKLRNSASKAAVVAILENVHLEIEGDVKKQIDTAHDQLYRAYNPLTYHQLQVVKDLKANPTSQAKLDELGRITAQSDPKRPTCTVSKEALEAVKLDLETLGGLAAADREAAFQPLTDKIELAEALTATEGPAGKLAALKASSDSYGEQIEALKVAIGEFQDKYPDIDVTALQEAAELLNAATLKERVDGFTSSNKGVLGAAEALNKLLAVSEADVFEDEQKTQIIGALEALRPVDKFLGPDRLEGAKQVAQKSTLRVMAPMLTCAMLALALVGTKYWVAPRYFPTVKWLQL